MSRQCEVEWRILFLAALCISFVLGSHLRLGGRVDGWTGGRVDGWTGGRVDGWTGGRVDGWTEGI